ncbi:large subunit ribosomal protein L27e [Nematocida major]|uniref:large subunit ribosomal protein L27e n=1 Tax=Nematocida major TaxID=1912982 RepID=UPI0020089FEE|nr:large subunit ribosomal protein L27e [Nematocida major]KAH9387188.1 large subunit ribosomal protein L27e [Nematocida major]
MLLEKEKVVLLSKGRYAGCKGVILDDLKKGDKYEYVTVVGISKAPRPVTENMTERQKNRRESMKCFVKRMNVRHIMATKYTMENVFDKLEIVDVTDMSEKVEMLREAERLFKGAYANNPSHWIFKKQAI